jgi:hypothetical protein
MSWGILVGMEDPTVKRERPTIPARRFVRPRTVSPAAALEALLLRTGSKGPAATGGPHALLGDELVEIPPQSDVRHLREELLGCESGTFPLDRSDAQAANHERREGRG